VLKEAVKARAQVTANTADTRERTFTDWVFVKLDFTDFDFS